MNNDDPDSMKTTVHTTSISYGRSTSVSDGVTTPTHENPSVEDWLFDMAARCHVPLRRLDGESLHSLANRLVLNIEHRIAFSLLNLQEIHELDLDENEDRAS